MAPNKVKSTLNMRPSILSYSRLDYTNTRMLCAICLLLCIHVLNVRIQIGHVLSYPPSTHPAHKINRKKRPNETRSLFNSFPLLSLLFLHRFFFSSFLVFFALFACSIDKVRVYSLVRSEKNQVGWWVVDDMCAVAVTSICK